MKILMINSVCGIRSTGRICTDIAKMIESKDNDIKIAYGRENIPKECQKYAIRIGTNIDVNIHALQARLFDKSGFGSTIATKNFINWAKEYDPDIIHLHNLHGYYINVEILFEYLKASRKKIIWTLHDCWSFTGHCVYCHMDMCEKWKHGCNKCISIHEYPFSFYDNVASNWKKKKEIFTSLENMTIVTPSQWLCNKVNESFLGKYETKVINNGIDTNNFKHTKSNIKEKYCIFNKKIILGVASIWDTRKGLNDFIKLSKRLPSEYLIVLIGLTEKQISKLPDNVLGIKRTNNTKELAEWYSVAEVFINPTYEDNYPTTNLEAIACGTPVITYNTGGSPESATIYGKIVSNIDFIDLDTIRFERTCRIDMKTFSRQIMAEKYANLYY